MMTRSITGWIDLADLLQQRVEREAVVVERDFHVLDEPGWDFLIALQHAAERAVIEAELVAEIVPPVAAEEDASDTLDQF